MFKEMGQCLYAYGSKNKSEISFLDHPSIIKTEMRKHHTPPPTVHIRTSSRNTFSRRNPFLSMPFQVRKPTQLPLSHKYNHLKR
ncbi:hypothetical protein L2E82_21769 [Cichorium intybus]|uniref:Uncharacterized protein n=1 Tax=Cichorium intybus TaxID=13427 RepID=A0ACB9DWT2_CICIN|nr:hypothetical protein L2E82_21769 [Cichorium intybus]